MRGRSLPRRAPPSEGRALKGGGRESRKPLVEAHARWPHGRPRPGNAVAATFAPRRARVVRPRSIATGTRRALRCASLSGRSTLPTLLPCSWEAFPRRPVQCNGGSCVVRSEAYVPAVRRRDGFGRATRRVPGRAAMASSVDVGRLPSSIGEVAARLRGYNKKRYLCAA